MTARQHLDLLGLLFVAYGCLILAFGLVIAVGLILGGVSMGIAGAAGGDQDMLIVGGVYGVAAVLSGVLVFGFGAAYVAVGVGLRRQARWSRIGGLVAGAVALTNMPLGTLLGVYALVKLLDADVRALLEGGAPVEDPLA